MVTQTSPFRLLEAASYFAVTITPFYTEDISQGSMSKINHDEYNQGLIFKYLNFNEDTHSI